MTIRCFTRSFYEGLMENRQYQCACLTNEECVMKILVGHLRFQYEDHLVPGMNANTITLNIDEEKKKILRQIAAKRPNVLEMDHYWSPSSFEISHEMGTEELVLNLACQSSDIDFLFDFGEIFSQQIQPILVWCALIKILTGTHGINQEITLASDEVMLQRAIWVDRAYKALQLQEPNWNISQVDYLLIDDPRIVECCIAIRYHFSVETGGAVRFMLEAITKNHIHIFRRMIAFFYEKGWTLNVKYLWAVFFMCSAPEEIRREMAEDLLMAGVDPLQDVFYDKTIYQYAMDTDDQVIQ